MVNMDAMRRDYEEAGIELCHVPIEDFHGVSIPCESVFVCFLLFCGLERGV